MVEVKNDVAYETILRDFRTFIAVVHPGRSPYQWQERLLEYLVIHGQWPERLAVPTGAGKTSVIDIHVFANAMAGLIGEEEQEHTRWDKLPRRLVLTVNRRGLVDDQFDEADRLRTLLLERDGEQFLDKIRQGLIFRANYEFKEKTELAATDFFVVKLRGGAGLSPEQSKWRYFPAACAVICATPDMFGSRLLFGGYGTSRGMRPVEAGLLAFDTVLVSDEAHLSKQLLYTARRVSQLNSSFKSGIEEAVTTLQVVETTATPASDDNERINEVKIQESDFAQDSELEKRLKRPKLLKVESPVEESLLPKMIARACQQYIERDSGVVACIVNNVETASKIAKELKEAFSDDENEAIISVTGPTREYDRQSLSTLIHAMRKGESTSVRCVVGTQTLEVGLDADFSALVTELAPVTALVQRFGRVNRSGKRDSSEVKVFSAEGREPAAPYEKKDLRAARTWLESVVNNQNGISPWIISRTSLPQPQPSRMLYQRLEAWDVENFSHTSEDLAADYSLGKQGARDLNLWLRDNLESDADPEIGVVVRNLPHDTFLAERVLQLAPPLSSEVFPVQSRGQLLDLQKVEGFRRWFIYRAEYEGTEQSVVSAEGEDQLKKETVRHGDIVVVDAATVEAFDTAIHTLAPKQKMSAAERDVFNDASEDTIVLKVDDSEVIRDLLELDPEEESSEAQDLLFHIIKQEAVRCTGLKEWSNASPNQVNYGFTIIEDDSEEDRKFWIIITRPSASIGKDVASEITLTTSNKKPARLLTEGGHEAIVGSRAERIGRYLGLPENLVQVLRQAGLHHDDGKKDLRFQGLLRYRVAGASSLKPEDYQNNQTYWAKSRFRSPSWEQRYRLEHGLNGWRHEQRSVAEFAALLKSTDDFRVDFDSQLALRLVGTSHGWGRSTFVQNTDSLIPKNLRDDSLRAGQNIMEVVDQANELFNQGGWATLIDVTSWTYGFWGCAYLEALLRSADITVSMEGY